MTKSSIYRDVIPSLPRRYPVPTATLSRPYRDVIPSLNEA